MSPIDQQLPPSVEKHGENPMAVLSAVVTNEGSNGDHLASRIASNISTTRRLLSIGLILLCNLIQFISMFSTVAGGFELSARLGRADSPGQANWMAAAYSLSQSAFVLVSGRFGDVYGHARILFLGLAIIITFSLANAFCTTYSSFVAIRAMTGIGGGILMPNAVAILTNMNPPGRSRNFVLALFAASPPVGAWIGAMLIGVFLQYAQWRWHFITIACLATVVLMCLMLLLPRESPVDLQGTIDWIGFGLGLVGLILFNLAWNQAPALTWKTTYIIVLLAISIVCLAAFFVWSSKYAQHPIMPLSIFKAPSFNALIVVTLFIYMSVGIALWYMVAWQQLVRGWTVLHLAIGWLPYAIGATIAVLLAAWLIPRLEAQYILAFGCTTSILACVLLATMPEQQSYWAQIFPATVLGAFCPDFVYVAAQIIASNSVQPHEQGVAGSLIGTLNLYGNSLGLGFAGTVEVYVRGSSGNNVIGFRAALWFGFALAVAAGMLNRLFVRMPKHKHSTPSDNDASTASTRINV